MIANSFSTPPPTPSWQIYLLGGIKIIHQGQELSPPPNRAQALFAAILLHKQPRQRLNLASLLAPDVPESTALRTLSDQLWILRRALPQLPVEANREYIHLPAQTRWLDVEAFRQAEQSPDFAAWLSALTLYQGDLLPGIYSEWLLLERERMHLRWIRLMRRVVDQCLAQNEYTHAHTWLKRLTQAEPLDEAALRLLMQTCAALGKRGEALAAYEQYAQYLAQEMQIVPEAITQALAESFSTSRFVSGLPRQSSMEGSSPTNLLHRARQALILGDLLVLQQTIPILRQLHPKELQLEIDLLEVDYALLSGDISFAANHLQQLDSELLPVIIRQVKLALLEGDLEQARTLASRLLLAAHELEDLAGEVEALLALTQVQRRSGEMSQAVVSIEKTCQSAFRLGDPDLLARAILEQALIAIRQGLYADALSLMQQAATLAEEYGLKARLAEITFSMGGANNYLGSFMEARSLTHRALSLWRDLGNLPQEASSLQRLAWICNQIGESAQALQYLEQSEQIYEQLNDELGLARNQYNLAAALPYHDEALTGRGIILAQKALKTFRKLDQSDWQASTLATLGYNLWVAGEYDEAIRYLEEAYQAHENLGEVAVLPELLAYQALAHLGLGTIDQAEQTSQRALLALAQTALENDIVSEIYYAYACVQHALGNHERAQDYYQRAYLNLVKYAQQFKEHDARQAFFRRDPTVRRLMSEVYKRGMAPAPHSGIVQGWATSRTGRQVHVHWTLDAGPADIAVQQSQGSAALRRARLERILRESAAQNVVPTQKQLARLLNVSTRTIKRDMASLRKRVP